MPPPLLSLGATFFVFRLIDLDRVQHDVEGFVFVERVVLGLLLFCRLSAVRSLTRHPHVLALGLRNAYIPGILALGLLSTYQVSSR